MIYLKYYITFKGCVSMSTEFAAKISAIRKEKNITQKAAADALGISQALLSHYEKGIRECNLTFIMKAAAYYEVTTDYLLGYSESRYGSEISLDEEEIESDFEMKSVTLMRAMLFLMNRAQASQTSAAYFNDFFSLSLKKYLDSINEREENIKQITDMAQNLLSAVNFAYPLSDAPPYIETVSSYAREVVEKELRSLLQEENK